MDIVNKLQTYEQLNYMALEELNKQNNYGAFKMLTLNQKLYPNFLTNHNLGVFISEEGWYSRNASMGKNRYLLGLKYLNNAIRYEKNYLTYFAIGTVFLEIQKHKKAEDAFKEALIKENYVIFNCLGISCFKQKKYKEAKEYFSKALALCDREEDKYCILLSYGFACAKSNDLEMRSVFLELVSKKFEKEHDIDLIKLAFLCNDTKYILNNYKRIYDTWEITLQDFIIVTNTLKANKLFEKAKELTKEFFANSFKKKIVYIIKSPLNVKKIIFVPKQFYQCNYIDCPVHDNSSL